jgi:hypothetical protein
MRVRTDIRKAKAAAGFFAAELRPRRVRKRVRQAEIDTGARPGVSSQESAEVRMKRAENRELRAIEETGALRHHEGTAREPTACGEESSSGFQVEVIRCRAVLLGFKHCSGRDVHGAVGQPVCVAADYRRGLARAQEPLRSVRRILRVCAWSWLLRREGVPVGRRRELLDGAAERDLKSS